MPTSKRTTIHQATSPYGTYEVIDETYNGRPARVLYGDEATPQSGTALDEEPDLLFSYNQRFFECIMSQHPLKLLVIGGGGFMLPTAVWQRLPDTAIDVVEIDETLVNIAHEYFDLPHDERLAVHVADGAAFVAQSTKRYDMIILDAFSGSTIPPHLLEHKTLEHYKERLSRMGSIAVNFIAEYLPDTPSLSHELLAAFRETFAHVALYQADPDYPAGEYQNYILIAGAEVQHYDYLQSTELELL